MAKEEDLKHKIWGLPSKDTHILMLHSSMTQNVMTKLKMTFILLNAHMTIRLFGNEI